MVSQIVQRQVKFDHVPKGYLFVSDGARGGTWISPKEFLESADKITTEDIVIDQQDFSVHKHKNTMWSWGQQTEGQLPEPESEWTKVAVGSNNTAMFLKNNGEIAVGVNDSSANDTLDKYCVL